MPAEIIRFDQLPPFDNVGIAHAVRHGRMLFISGQIAIDKHGNIVGKGDVTAQTRHVYDIISGLLKQAGGSLGNVVKLLTFYVNPEDFRAMAEVRRSYFSSSHLAASTAVCVRALPFADALVEVEAVAILDGD